MEEKLLISENREEAESLISHLRSIAMVLTRLILDYCHMPYVRQLSSKEDAFAFLRDPLNYLDDAIRLGVNVDALGIPNPDITLIAQLFKIPYKMMQDLIRTSRPDRANLQYYDFDPATLTVSLMPGAEALIMEQSRIYLTDTDEIAEWKRREGFCRVLNEEVRQMNIMRDNAGDIAKILALDIKFEQNRPVFSPSISGVKIKVAADKRSKKRTKAQS